MKICNAEVTPTGASEDFPEIVFCGWLACYLRTPREEVRRFRNEQAASTCRAYHSLDQNLMQTMDLIYSIDTH